MAELGNVYLSLLGVIWVGNELIEIIPSPQENGCRRINSEPKVLFRKVNDRPILVREFKVVCFGGNWRRARQEREQKQMPKIGLSSHRCSLEPFFVTGRRTDRLPPKWQAERRSEACPSTTRGRSIRRYPTDRQNDLSRSPIRRSVPPVDTGTERKDTANKQRSQAVKHAEVRIRLTVKLPLGLQYFHLPPRFGAEELSVL